MELPFIHRYKENKESLMTRINEEKNLNGDEIREIVKKKLRDAGFLTIQEKNYLSSNDNPFDLVAGDEEELKLHGFEIKGDTDNFSRLKTQLQAYLFAFKSVYLVLHKKEKPEWLPEYVGVLRVSENGDVITEYSSWFREDLNISSEYEWDVLFRENGLSITSTKTRNTLKIISDVRQNVLFNRFFGKLEGYNIKKFEKFYPFTEQQKAVLIGFDVPYHYKKLEEELMGLEKRTEVLKKIISVGQKGLKEFNKTK